MTITGGGGGGEKKGDLISSWKLDWGDNNNISYWLIIWNLPNSMVIIRDFYLSFQEI